MLISGERKICDVSYNFGVSRHSNNIANKNGNIDNDSNCGLVELGRFTLLFIFGSKQNLVKNNILKCFYLLMLTGYLNEIWFL